MTLEIMCLNVFAAKSTGWASFVPAVGTLMQRFCLCKVPIRLLGEPVMEYAGADCLLYAKILEMRWGTRVAP